MKKPYKEMDKDKLSEIYNDYIESKRRGIRCESFVPYAKEIKENIGGDYTLAEAIDWTKQDFFDEVCKRYFQ